MRALKTKVYGEVLRLITRRLPENSLGIQRYQFARFLFEEAQLDLSTSDRLRLGLGAQKS